MKRLMVILLFIMIASAPILAQQKDELPKAADAASADKQAGTVIVPAPKFVFKDGAFYLEISGSAALIPVSGGGSSGCLTLDLPVRVRTLKELIEDLPTNKPPVRKSAT